MNPNWIALHKSLPVLIEDTARGEINTWVKCPNSWLLPKKSIVKTKNTITAGYDFLCIEWLKLIRIFVLYNVVSPPD